MMHISTKLMIVSNMMMVDLSIYQADIVLLGISRTSKTPLSQYLAHKSYKVMNVPIVPEAPPYGL